MIKKYEVEQMLKDALFEMDGAVDAKPNSEGCYDVYFVSTENIENGFLVDFTTVISGMRGKEEHDKYKITVEYCE